MTVKIIIDSFSLMLTRNSPFRYLLAKCVLCVLITSVSRGIFKGCWKWSVVSSTQIYKKFHSFKDFDFEREFSKVINLVYSEHILNICRLWCDYTWFTLLW